MNKLANLLKVMIFSSRWLQAPLYLGLIVAQGVYVYKFAEDLLHLLLKAHEFSETAIMLSVIGLIDVVMVANLLIMVIIGGYETFVSRLNLDGHPDEPEWLDHLNAGSMKIKFAISLIGISSIHLLKSFINLDAAQVSTKLGQITQLSQADNWSIFWQVVIHLTFVVSALLMAITDRYMANSPKKHHGHT
jgi:uncharacterized protein (TIGR00645 family)